MIKVKCSRTCICGYTKKMLDNVAKRKCKRVCGIEKKVASLNCNEKALLSTYYTI